MSFLNFWCSVSAVVAAVGFLAAWLLADAARPEYPLQAGAWTMAIVGFALFGLSNIGMLIMGEGEDDGSKPK